MNTTTKLPIIIHKDDKFEFKSLLLKQSDFVDDHSIYLLSVEYMKNGIKYMISYNYILFDFKKLWNEYTTLISQKYLHKIQHIEFKDYHLVQEYDSIPVDMVSIPFSSITSTSSEEFLQFLEINYPELFY